MDISAAAQPRSDQINADDLIGGPQLVHIADVRKGSSEQPVEIVTSEFGPGRPYKPGKSMIRVLIAAWGREASVYVGRQLMLYRDPTITFGKDAVGGIRISAMSHLDSRMTLALTVTRGKRAPFTVDPLPDAPAAITDDEVNEYENQIALVDTLDDLKALYEQLKSVELGSHRASLMAAVTARKAEIENAVVEQPTLDVPAE